jgi:CRP/FNR family transcriptional regulator, cyclic AMP receptor protein
MSKTAARILSRLPTFAGVPEASLARLAAGALRRRFAVGEALFRRGDPGEGMYVVIDGLVRIHLSDATGKEIVLALIGQNEPIGDIALLDGGPRSADATAYSPVTALLFRHTDAIGAIASDPALAGAMLRMLTSRLRRLTDQVEAYGLQPLAQRLAGALLHLSAADPSGLVRVPQGDVAALVAASRPQVNRTLSVFRARGWVASARAGLRLTDPEGLRRLADDASFLEGTDAR